MNCHQTLAIKEQFGLDFCFYGPDRWVFEKVKKALETSGLTVLIPMRYLEHYELTCEIRASVSFPPWCKFDVEELVEIFNSEGIGITIL